MAAKKAETTGASCAAGGRTPKARPGSLREVAEAAGVSKAAVSMILNPASPLASRFSEATRRRVLAAAERLGYKPNLLARGLKTARSPFLGLQLCLPPGLLQASQALFGPMLLELLLGVSLAASRRQLYPIVSVRSGRAGRGDLAVIEDLIASGVRGVMVYGASSPVLARLEQLRQEQGLVCLALFRGGARARRFRWWIDQDNVAAGTLATRVLLEQGHRRIACLVREDRSRVMRDRLLGYRAALQQAGIKPQSEWICRCPAVPAGRMDPRLLDVLGRFLRRTRCTGLVALNSGLTIAAAGLIWSREPGLAERFRFALVGHDIVGAQSPGLTRVTSVQVCWREVGEQAVEAIADEMQGIRKIERPILITPKIWTADGASMTWSARVRA